MIRSTRLGLLAALSTALLAATGCSSTPTDSEPVVIARTTPDPTTRRPAPAAPSAVPAAPAASATDVPETPDAAAPADTPIADRRDELGTEDLLFLANITEFTLMEKPESDQIRLGLSMCNALYRGQDKSDLTAEYREAGTYTPAEITNVLGAATIAYCPEFV